MHCIGLLVLPEFYVLVVLTKRSYLFFSLISIQQKRRSIQILKRDHALKSFIGVLDAQAFLEIEHMRTKIFLLWLRVYYETFIWRWNKIHHDQLVLPILNNLPKLQFHPLRLCSIHIHSNSTKNKRISILKIQFLKC